MEYTKLQHKVQALIPEAAWGILSELMKKGARPVLVGGAVRDLLLGAHVKDIDIEVHGIALNKLEDILKIFGHVRMVGKTYGVLRIDSIPIDWSLPRTDSSGRKPKVTIDPSLSIKDAFARRDLTLNALGIDLKTFELLDPFGGLDDIKHKRLRTPDPKRFVEDPLRLYRVMQFVGRFSMQPDDELNELCAFMNVSDVSVERVEQEFNKLFLYSPQPSLGVKWLHTIGRLQDLFPELYALIGLEQTSEYHPEGDVFEHTMQAIDSAATFSYDGDKEKLVIMYATLCHDLGKPEATHYVDGRLRSIGHEDVGVAVAQKLLRRLTRNHDLIDRVVVLVKYHMCPGQLVKQNASLAAYKRLAKKLEPLCTMLQLAYVFRADVLARNPNIGMPLTAEPEAVRRFLECVRQAAVEKHAELPVLTGKDLAGIVEPGPKMGNMLKKAYEIQINNGITDKDKILKLLLLKSAGA